MSKPLLGINEWPPERNSRPAASIRLLQGLQGRGDAFYAFPYPLRRGAHQRDADMAFTRLSEADSRGDYHALALHQQLGQLYGRTLHGEAWKHESGPLW